MTTDKYSIFDNMIEGVQIVSSDWRYIYVNEAVIKQSKLSNKELLGHTMMERYPDIEKTKLFEAIQDCLSSKTSHQIINEFTFPDNSTGYFQLRIEPVIEGALIFSYDITDQKTAEELIKRTNTELEEIIRQRTRELVEKSRVIESQILRLEELNRTKDMFFSIIAHDFKSPLNSVKSFATLLINNIEKLDKEEIIKISKQFELSIDTTIKMADNLIAWAMLQMKHNETRLEKIFIMETISPTIDVFKEVARKKGIAINCSVEKDCSVMADKNQVEFIIRNLVNNAIKFTNKNGSIVIKAETTSNGQIQIAITDNGIGMSEEVKKELFSIGRKRSLIGTDGEKGTGLGIMLCNEFVKLNNGQIDIESQIGKGTTFNIRLQNGTE